MSDILGVSARFNGSALEFYDKATGRTVSILDAAFGPQFSVPFTATLAQINAGMAILADDPNRTILPVGIFLKVTGSFSSLTDIRLSDNAASPVDIVTFAQAQLTNGTAFGLTSTGVTIGAGFGVKLTAGKGVNIRQTGSAGTVGTSVFGILHYILQ